jgi:hypothetical protein
MPTPVQEIRSADSSFATHRPEGHFGTIMRYFYLPCQEAFCPGFPQGIRHDFHGVKAAPAMRNR